MNLSDLLFMLTGAALLALGVLASALADRIRGLRVTRDARRDPRAPKVSSRTADPADTIAASRAIFTQPTAASSAMAKDVIEVLVTSGFRKQEAAAAVAACAGSECSTLESWTRAALRKASPS